MVQSANTGAGQQSGRRTTRTAAPGAFPADGSGTETGRILFVVTSHEVLGKDNGEPTGFHLAEVARPWSILRAAGYEIDIASPKGGAAPIDPGSLDSRDSDNAALLRDANAAHQLRNTFPLDRVNAKAYVAVYFPGGHGAMWDFPDNPHIQRIAADIWERGGVIAAVCHGPAALVNVRNAEGLHLLEGKRVAAFTDDEEHAVGKAGVVPFLLAGKLKERGARHETAEDFRKMVIVDERLVTGQNPASAAAVGEAMRDALENCSTLTL